MKRHAWVVAWMSIVLVGPLRAADPPKLELKDGDRIVYLGNTFVERDQSYGYFETLLTTSHPDIDFTFRNLGWSGDTVWGDARARFGTRADGFVHLKEHVLALKPTIILIAYGMNESFAGEAGLNEFETGLNALIDTLGQTNARVFFITPMPHEKLGPPLPDPSVHNRNLKLYRDVIAKVADKRKIGVVDLLDLIDDFDEVPKWNLTDDGLHLTPRGSALVMEYIGKLLGIRTASRELSLNAAGTVQSTAGWKLDKFEKGPDGYKFEAIGDTLPYPPYPAATAVGMRGTYTGGGGISLRLKGLPAGQLALKVDGKIIKRFSCGEGTCEVMIESGPEIDQVEKLRALINKKNELYFHRWRPQNETYLFGFRKHEQGNNAVEIPQFDPLVAELEAHINVLKKPVKHAYELIRAEAGK